MNRSHRAKAVAGLGILSILLGAFMVFAPAASSAENPTMTVNPGGNDNPSCSDLGYTVEAKDNTERNAPYSGTADSGEDPDLLVDYDLNIDKTVDFEVDDDSEYLVSAVIIKKGDSNSGGGARVYTYDPSVASDEGLETIKDSASFSHITFCSNKSLNTTTTSEATTSTTEGSTTTEESTTTTEESTTTTEATTTTTEATTTTTEATTTTTEGDVLGTSTTVGDVTSTTEGPEVEGDAVTTTEAPVVLDNTVSPAQLAKTGTAADRLAPIGAALMILGAVLLGGSRRWLLIER